MSLRIPLPDAPAGSVMQGMLQANELKKSNLENRMLDLQNQYYAPNIQSEIANRNALTQGQVITNQYLPDKLRLANAFQQLQNQYYGPDIQSQIANRYAQTNNLNTMTPLNAQELQLKNQYYPALTQAQIGAQQALSNFRNMGGAQMGVGQKEMMGFQRQLMQDHPDWDPSTANAAASSYLSGGNMLPDGTALPPLSGLGQAYVAQVQKRNSTAAIQNQAANMDVLASDVNDIDIRPVAAFAGLKGKLNYAQYAADMAAGRPVPQEFRDYIAFKDVAANFAMDDLRKGFGIYVVPDYVYKTLGKASQPNSQFWFDPEQVFRDWKEMTSWVNKNAQKYKAKATQGVGADVTTKNTGRKWVYNQATGKLEPQG